ncbi:cytochrome P450 [Streptomyces sp. NPDC058637]|uniref:cytochrome P450 n=1 Tax=Streptomyces sp. NPDC058637 TaxID=3346569 RepID=UPI003667BAC1
MGMVRTVPQAPGALPLLGHGLALRRDPLAFMMSLPAHGDLVQIRVGPVRALVVCDPGLVQRVLTDDRTFDKGGLLIERVREGLGNGLGTCPHGDHRRQRRLTQPAFHAQRIPAYAEVMTREATRAVDGWTHGRDIDVLPVMQEIAARTTMATMFADTPGTDTTAVLKSFNIFSHGIYQRMLLPHPLDRLPLPANRRYNQARAHLHQAIGSIIADHRARGIQGTDLLSMLLTTSENGQRLTDDEIDDQVMSFFFGGIETVAATLAWALHEIARHPQAEERLHAEVDAALPAGAPATFDLLPHLTYTGRIITEILRLYPPGWLLTRITTTPTDLDGYPIPKGATVVCSPYLIHHHPDLHPDPERFDPDRWTGQSATGRNGLLIPFGGGARKCIADTFGVTEATLALATITARWCLTHTPGTDVTPALGAILNPRGLHMRPTAREPARTRTV